MSSGTGIIALPQGLDEGLVEVPERGTVRGSVVAVLFVLVVCATAVIDRVDPVERAKPVGEEALRIAAARGGASLRERFLTGKLASDFADELQSTSRVRSTLATPYTAALYHWLHEAHGRTAIVGRDGWLFVAQRTVPPQAESEALMARWSTQLAALDRRLACLGVRLLVLPLPRRAVVCADHLPSGIDPRPDIDERSAAALRERGVDAVDLFPDYLAWKGEPLFYRADAHWNELAEKLTSERVGEHLGLDPGRARKSRIQAGGVETQGARDDRNKDLYRFVGISDEGPWMPFLRGPDVPMFDVVDLKGRPLPRTKPPAPMTRVALTGTSFSARRDFSRMLAHALDEPVYDVSRQASGPIVPILDLLRGASGTLPELLIAEFPIYTMFDPLTMGEVGTVLVEFPPSRVHSLDVPLELDPKLRLGQEFGCGPSLALFRISPGSLVTSGDGVVMVRVRGEVLEGRVRFANEVSGELWGYNWEPGRGELLLPILARRSNFSGESLFVRALDRKPARIRIDAVELVTTLDAASGTELAETSREVTDAGWTLTYEVGASPFGSGGHGLLVRLLDEPAPGTRTRVEAVLADGSVRALGGGKPRVDARFALSGAGLAALGVRSLQLVGSGPGVPLRWEVRVAEDCGAGR